MLLEEIQQAKLNNDERALFKSLLITVGMADGGMSSLEIQFIEKMFPTVANEFESTIEQLWPYADLLLSTCVCLAVLNGRYPVEKARQVSQIAHSLGFSAKKLRKLEEQALHVIRFRGEQISEDSLPLPPKVNDDRIPTVIQDAPFPELLTQLWYSDAELIQTADGSFELDMDLDIDLENDETTD